jgi:hypothetical protein
VSIATLVLIILFVTRLIDTTSKVTAPANTHMDADMEARPLLDRMAADFAQMVKRSDVDYYLKSPSNPQIIDAASNPTGNDQLAFFSTVPGYYPAVGSPSPVSLVAYRFNTSSTSPSYLKLERMGKGLLWNGVSPTSTPVVFLPITISSSWAAATSNRAIDTDYEPIGPDVIRFEYYYVLKSGALSLTPWDTNAGHTSPSGMQDVVAICVAIAVIPPKERVLIPNPQVVALASQMNDFAAGMNPGDLLNQWQSALDAATAVPRPALATARLYQRYFYLAPKQ